MGAVIDDCMLVDYAARTYQREDPAIIAVDDALRIFVDDRDSSLRVVSIEGTHDPIGWALDFLVLGAHDHGSAQHEKLGFLHAGFLTSADAVYDQVKELVKDRPFVICGHSLGGALAILLGAMLIVDNIRPLRIGAFAPPRVGSEQLVSIVTSVRLGSYEYGNDPVPRVPFRIPPLWPYLQVPTKNIGTPMDDEFACHAIENYVRGVHALNPGGTPC